MQQVTWTLPSPTKVMHCIEQWRSLDLRKMPDDEIDKELSFLIDNLGAYPGATYCNIFRNLFRVRKFEYLFKDISECWEPPVSRTPLGRCNAKKHPVLYVSEKLETALEELNVEKDEYFYIIQYKNSKHSKPVNLKEVVSKNFIATDANKNPLYDKEGMLTYQILREFIRSEFLKPVGDKTEYLHKISASICRVWFHDLESDGWIYPSVLLPKERNIALKPHAARDKLEVEKVCIARLVSKDKVKRHRDEFLSHPDFHSVEKAIEIDFAGNMVEDKINWEPLNDLAWI